MLGVYNYMALGVAFTAIIVMAVAANPAALAAVYSLKWVFFIATLGLGFFAPRLIFSGNTALAHAAYWGLLRPLGPDDCADGWPLPRALIQHGLPGLPDLGGDLWRHQPWRAMSPSVIFRALAPSS
jgi:hypothetical protein